MRKDNNRDFVTIKEIVKMSKSLTPQKVMTVVNNRLLRGTHKKGGTYYIPRDIAKDYVFIVDNPELIRLAILKRAKDVCEKYDTSNVQICKSVGLDSTFLSKLKCSDSYGVTYRTIHKLCNGPVGLHCRISTLVEIAKNDNGIYTLDLNRDYRKKEKTKKTYKENNNQRFSDLDKDIDSLFITISKLETSIDDLRREINMLKETKKDDKRKLREYNKQDVQ